MPNRRRPRRRRRQTNPDYNALLVTPMGTEAVGALTRLYAYTERDPDSKEQHPRLAGKVIWEPGVRLPDIVDAADLRIERVPCPGCGHQLTVRPHATRLRCPQCGALAGVKR